MLSIIVGFSPVLIYNNIIPLGRPSRFLSIIKTSQLKALSEKPPVESRDHVKFKRESQKQNLIWLSFLNLPTKSLDFLAVDIHIQ